GRDHHLSQRDRDGNLALSPRGAVAERPLVRARPLKWWARHAGDRTVQGPPDAQNLSPAPWLVPAPQLRGGRPAFDRPRTASRANRAREPKGRLPLDHPGDLRKPGREPLVLPGFEHESACRVRGCGAARQRDWPALRPESPEDFVRR